MGLKKLTENKTIYIQEWSKLNPKKIKDKYGIRKLSMKDFDLINKIEDKVKIKQLSSGIEIQTTSYVGTIKLEKFQLVINPKIKNIHLMKMIAFSYEIENINFIDEKINLNTKDSLVSDIISFLFLKEAAKIYSKGFIKRYKKIEQNIAGCKGKINFNKLAVNQKPDLTLPCRFEKLTVDVPENQLILSTLKFLLNNTKNRQLKKDINLLILKMIKQISDKSFNKKLLFKAKSSNDRLAKSYVKLINLVEMILHNFNFDLNDGIHKYKSFLVDMNNLFERFLYKYFIEINDSYNNKIGYQKYLNNFYTDNTDKYKLQPDFMVFKNDNLIKIADAKYKNYDENRIQSTDLYQLTSYSLANNDNIRKIYLLYPSNSHKIRKYRLTQTNIQIILEQIPLVKILNNLPEIYNELFEFIS